MPAVKPDELRERIAERIRELAAKRGISQRELADRAGVSRGHLWNVLAAKSAATVDVLAKLAEALDVDPDALVRRPRKPRSVPT
ncbi:MAG: helix-turn-helix transcriptional regulator [Nannocystaceae bacterium]